MTDQEINMAIAGACGLILIEDADPRKVRRWARSHNPFWGSWETADNSEGKWYGRCPDYCHDLNAMHAAEVTLSGLESVEYSGRINESVHGPTWGFDAITLLPEKRAKAFLRVKGLLKE